MRLRRGERPPSLKRSHRINPWVKPRTVQWRERLAGIWRRPLQQGLQSSLPASFMRVLTGELDRPDVYTLAGPLLVPTDSRNAQYLQY